MEFDSPVSWRKKRSKPKVVLAGSNIYIIREYISPSEFYMDNERLAIIGNRFLRPCFEGVGRLFSFRVLKRTEECHRHALLVREGNAYHVDFRGKITDQTELDAIDQWMKKMKLIGNLCANAFTLDFVDYA